MNQKFILISLCALLCVSQAAMARIVDELDSDQLQKITSDKQVIVTENVAGKPWPQITVYQFIPCTPEEAEAVTMDYDLRASYTRDQGCKYSKTSQVVDPVTSQVDYTAKIPILGDEHFTLQNHISTYDDGGNRAYLLEFHQIRADRAKTSEGQTRYEEFNSGTIMAAKSFVDPGVPMAGLVKGRAISQTAGAVDDFAKQVVAEKANEQALLQAQLVALRNALALIQQGQ